MNILLDTHALLWAFVAPKSLSAEASRIIADDENALMVSAVSVWEIATKVRNGKLPEAVALEGRFLDALDDAGYILLSIDAATALRAARLPADHRDPFARLIAAQALALAIPVLSKATKLDAFFVRRIW